MRMLSGRRHLLAILIVFAIVGLALILPTIIESVLPKRVERFEEATVLADILVEQMKKPEELMEKFVPPPPPLKSSIRYTAPIIKKDEEVSEEEEMKTMDELIENTSVISVLDVAGTDDDDAVLAVDLDDRNKTIVEETTVESAYTFVEQMPEFPGGEDELRKYLVKNIVYPAIAQENGIKGTVYLSFVVGPDGSLSKVQVVRGIDKSCDDEAVRVVNKMPPWKPGRQNGKAVHVKFTIPIKFELRNQ